MSEASLYTYFFLITYQVTRPPSVVFIPFLVLTTVSVLITSKYISLILSSSPVYSAASLTSYPCTSHWHLKFNMSISHPGLALFLFWDTQLYLHFSKEITIFRVAESKDLGHVRLHSSVSWLLSLSLYHTLFPPSPSQPLLSLSEMNESSCLLRSLPVHPGHPIAYP